MPEFEFAIGDKVFDCVTGFNGIVTARCQYGDYNTYQLTSLVKDDKSPIVEEWISASRVNMNLK